MYGMKEKAKKLYLGYIGGEPGDFEELVRLITPRFYRMFRHLGADVADAEDLCQQFFLDIHRFNHNYSRERDFMPWAYAVARNIYFKEYDRASRVKIIPLHAWIAAKEKPMDDENTVTALLSKLSDEKRIVFELKHFQDLKFNEIAEILKIPAGTVKSRMFAAVSELRQILEGEKS